MWRAARSVTRPTWTRHCTGRSRRSNSLNNQHTGERRKCHFPSPLFFTCEAVKINDKSKYNVSKDTEKRTYDGIVFDSKMEMRYYRDIVLPGVRSGKIQHYELQKPYELQPKFMLGDRRILPITYVADFYIEYEDGQREVIDIKGCADSVAKLKRKMFWYQYRETPYRWLTYVEKYGGWRDYDDVMRLRKSAKKQKVEMTTDEMEDENEQYQ